MIIFDKNKDRLHEAEVTIKLYDMSYNKKDIGNIKSLLLCAFYHSIGKEKFINLGFGYSKLDYKSKKSEVESIDCTLNSMISIKVDRFTTERLKNIDLKFNFDSLYIAYDQRDEERKHKLKEEFKKLVSYRGD